MISCSNCGFGHSTFEEVRACKPWSEVQAALECICGHRFDQHVQSNACRECVCDEFEIKKPGWLTRTGDAMTTGTKQNTDQVAPYDSPTGTKLRYAFPENGTRFDRNRCDFYLSESCTYTLDNSVIGESSTTFYLCEAPGIAFNSVMFAVVKDAE